MHKIKSLKTNIINIFKYLWVNKTQKKVWIPALVILIIILPMILGSKKDDTVLTYKVESKEFIQNVSLTGKVISAKNVDMAFEVSGRVNKVNFKVGDRVKKGQVIASLQNGDAVANLQKSSAKLRDIQNGARPEELAIAEGDLVGAQNDVNLSKQLLETELQDLYNSADDAIRFKIDDVFANPRSVNPQFLYSIDQNLNLKDKLSADRLKITEMMVKFKADVDSNNHDFNQVKVYANQIQSFINDVSMAISISTEKLNTTDSNYATMQSQKTNILTARSNFNNAINAFNQAQITYKNSLTSLNRAENDLKIKKSGGTQNEVAIYQADVINAQSLVQKTIITAPFDGVVTKIDIKEGEISSPNTPIISVLNDGEYQIETYVSENDVAKLKVDQVAKVTLDAYGRDVYFDASIISIDPAETIKDGVSTYRTKIQFIGKDDRIKSGMTANIDIETDRRQGVLSIPQSALFLEKGIKKVYVLENDKCVVSNTCANIWNKKKDMKAVEIKTGEINNNGDIEILSGLENNQIIIYGKK